MKRWLKNAVTALLIAVCVLLLLSMLVASTNAEWLIEVPFFLLTGWYFFFEQNFRGITWNWEAVASGSALLLLSLTAFHLLLRSIAATLSHSWRLKWSVLFLVLTVTIFGVSLAAGGIAHQVVWLMQSEKWIGGHTMVTKQFSKANQLRIAVELYAKDHAGAFPRNLEDLIEPDGLDLQMLEGLAFSWPPYEPPTAWIYVRGLSESAPRDLPLFISPRTFPARRLLIVTYGDSGEIMSEKKILKRLSKWRQGYAALGIPLPPPLAAYDVAPASSSWPSTMPGSVK
jgi:hypothetical protein